MASRGDGLSEYARRRDFAKTPEPAGGPPPAGDGRRFVVQRHRARRTHYDLRLEAGGVLVSWAVPKGLSLDPDAKHLAVHVEDHPVEYLDFEGVIPAGEYGGGDVIVWDRGTYDLVYADDLQEAVDRGTVHVDLRGEKLRGRFVLVRRGRDRSGREQWLVFKKRDEHAVPGWDPEGVPRSVRSGRTNEEVATRPEAVWRTGEPAARAGIDLSADRPDLAALDALAGGGEWEFDGVTLRLTNLDKVLFPPRRAGEAPLTKRDLVRYYASVAPVMVPYLEGRPLNLHRFPDGVGAKGFWHKAAPAHAPGWVTRWRDEGAGRGQAQWYVVADRPATLGWLANYAAVELHPWTSRVEDPHRPTYALVDIDPGERTSWDDVLVLARLFRTALEHLGLRGYPKTTGRRGLQIWIPVEPGPTFGETRAWVERLSRIVGERVPDLVSWRWERDRRGGRARLDYTQNARHKTLVAPYSVRAAPGAPVSVPIRWDELDDPALRPDRWTLRDVGDRLLAHGDPFAGVLRDRQRLPPLG